MPLSHEQFAETHSYSNNNREEKDIVNRMHSRVGIKSRKQSASQIWQTGHLWEWMLRRSKEEEDHDPQKGIWTHCPRHLRL
jgi:hypothetical protein